MATITEFSEYVDKHSELNERYFPHAESGPKKQGWFVTAFAWTIFFTIFRIVMALFVTPWLHRLVNSPKIKKIDHEKKTHFSNSLHRIVDSLDGIVAVCLWVAVIITILLFIMYMVNVIKRSRAFERDIWKNDAESRRITRSLLSSMQIRKRIKLLQNKIQKSRQSNSSNSSVWDAIADSWSSGKNVDNMSDEAKLDALKAFSRVTVMVNTRPDTVAHEELIKSYIVTFATPADSEAFDELDKLTKDIAPALARHVRRDRSQDTDGASAVNFGERIISDDRSSFYYGPVRLVLTTDKYAPRTVKVVKKDTTKYETTFDLGLFGDQREKIARIKKQAERHAHKQAPMVDNFLATKDIRANRIDTIVGATSVTYVYDAPLSFNSTNIDTIQKELDQQFKVAGNTVDSASGNLSVTIMLRKELVMPIDTASMYRETFGSST